MTGSAILFLGVAIVVVWGGLATSAIFLRRQPELTTWPQPDIEDTSETLGSVN